MRAHGLDPGGAPEVAPLDDTALQRHRKESGLQPLMPLLRSHLLPAGDAAGQLMVVADISGRVLWREGSAAISRHADKLGFVGGSAWTEVNVGTNGIGTCIVTAAPVHVHAAEHFAESHTPWTCAAAPLFDPHTGQMIGVVDLSGPAHTVHAGTISLVTAVARLVELELRAAHQDRLQELRSIAAPVLAKLNGRSLVIAQDGMTAAVAGFVGPDHIALPRDMMPGETWFPSLGQVTAEPLPGGWLLRLHDDAADVDEGQAAQLLLDLSTASPVLRVSGPSGGWSDSLTPRHAEILLSLVRHTEGRSAAELADDLFADSTRTVTVRAEMSRLRRTLGPLLAHRPYRIADRVACRVELPLKLGELLPASSAPIVAAVRAGRA